MPPRCPHSASDLAARGRALLALGVTVQRQRAALRGAFDDAGAVAEAGAEDHVGIGEETLLERSACGRACRYVACATGRARRRSRRGLGCTSALA
jgi:hypothetical protein